MAKKNRKWTNLPGTVPEEIVELSEKELAIRKATDERRAKSMSELAAEYGDLCEEEEFADLAKKARDIVYEALERLIGDQLKRIQTLSGQDTWRGDGQLFTPKISVIPLVADRTALMQYLKDTKQESLLTLEFPRLKSLTTTVLDDLESMTPAERSLSTVTYTEPLPGVKLYLKHGIRRTKA